MTDHEHVQVLIDGIDRKGTRRIGTTGQDIGLTDNLENIGSVTTTGTLRAVFKNNNNKERDDRGE